MGTFLSSNAHRPWWLLWLFVGGVLVAVMLYGYVTRDGDLSYGRLTRIPETGVFAGWMVIPPLVIPGLSRFGIPVSTTFLILTVFDPRGLESMLVKSLLGYAVALVIGYLVYRFAMRAAERHFIETSRAGLRRADRVDGGNRGPREAAFRQTAGEGMTTSLARRRQRPMAQATSRVMCQGERGAYSLCFVFVDEDGEEDAVH